jgi:hypothetical protein
VVDYTSYREELFTLGCNSLGLVESVTKTHRCIQEGMVLLSHIAMCQGEGRGVFSHAELSGYKEAADIQLLIASLPSTTPSIWKLINNVCSAPHSTQLHSKDQNYRKKLKGLKFSFTQGIFLAISQVITPMKGNCS